MVRIIPSRVRRSAGALAFLALGLAGAPGTAPAQQPVPPSPPAPTQPALTPTHLALARDVATASGITRSFDAILPRFGEQMRQQATTRPEITKDLDEVLDALKPEMELQRQRMVNMTAAIFASRLTEAELREVNTFFQSTAGKRYVETQPLVLDDLVTAMQGWTQEVSEYVMVRMRAEMGKRGHSLQ